MLSNPTAPVCAISTEHAHPLTLTGSNRLTHEATSTGRASPMGCRTKKWARVTSEGCSVSAACSLSSRYETPSTLWKGEQRNPYLMLICASAKRHEELWPEGNRPHTISVTFFLLAVADPLASIFKIPPAVSGSPLQVLGIYSWDCPLSSPGCTPISRL